MSCEFSSSPKSSSDPSFLQPSSTPNSRGRFETPQPAFQHRQRRGARQNRVSGVERPPLARSRQRRSVRDAPSICRPVLRLPPLPPPPLRRPRRHRTKLPYRASACGCGTRARAEAPELGRGTLRLQPARKTARSGTRPGRRGRLSYRRRDFENHASSQLDSRRARKARLRLILDFEQGHKLN